MGCPYNTVHAVIRPAVPCGAQPARHTSVYAVVATSCAIVGVTPYRARAGRICTAGQVAHFFKIFRVPYVILAS